MENLTENLTDNITEKTREYYSTASAKFQSLDNNYKYLALVIAIIVIVAIVYFVRRRYSYSASRKNLFLTSIDQDDPFNARDGKFQYTYNGVSTPYIPAERMVELNTSNTFSFWYYVDSKQWDYKNADWKHMWHRGDDLSLQLKNSPPAKYESPGFWITPNTNNLVCIISTMNTAQNAQGDAQPANIYEQISLEDIEMNKWTHIAVVIAGDNATLYRNGRMEYNKGFKNAIAINKDNLYIAQMGGFGGNLAYLRFYPSALTPDTIYEVYKTDLPNIKRYIEYEKSSPNKQDKYPDIFKFLQCPKCSPDQQQQQSANQQPNQGETSTYTKQLTGKLDDVKSYLTEREM